MWQFHSYTLVLFGSTLIALALARVIWRAGRPERLFFSLMMVAGAEWSFMRALEGLAADLEGKVFWAKLSYLGISTVPTLWFLFSMTYSRPGFRTSGRRLLLLSLLPVGFFALAATNEYHWLVWPHIRWPDLQPGPHLKYGHGPVFWMMVAYGYVLMTIGSLSLIWAAVRSLDIYRRHAPWLLAGAAFPLLGNVLYLSGHSPIPHVDPTAFCFTLTGLLYAWTIFRYQILDLMPVAQNLLVERTSDGVLVIDARGRVVDFNPAVARLLDLTHASIGLEARQVLTAWPEVMERYGEVREATIEICLDRDAQRFVELRISPLNDQVVQRGTLLILRDISAYKRVEASLLDANERLHHQLEENHHLQAMLREQAIRDPLTGLFNRRYLEETLQRELLRAAREDLPVSLAVLDLDRFKALNDRWGHDAGDRMLQLLGELLGTHLRASDMACRYGGEEFVVVMPGATAEVAAQRIEELRVIFGGARLSYEGVELEATFSGGVAAYPEHGRLSMEVLRAADRALYLAKAGGRDQVVLWGESTGGRVQPVVLAGLDALKAQG